MRLRWLGIGLLLCGLGWAQTHPVSLLDIMRLKAVGDAQISPDGQWVLYTVRGWTPEPTSNADAKNPPKETARTHIWIVSATAPTGAGAARQLTFGEKGENAPEWSPDGRYISFVADRGAAAGAGAAPPEAQIYLMRADGGEARQLTHGHGGASSYAWAPNSESIAFLRRKPLSSNADALRKAGDDANVYEGDFQPVQVWTVNVASGNERDLTGDFAMTARGLAWAPDSRQLAIEAAPTPLLRDNRTNIYLLGTEGGAMRQLTHGLSSSSAAAWSPDGKQIAYIHVLDAFKPLGDGIPFQDEHKSHLMLLDVATGASRDLASPDFDLSAGAPMWTPDGSHILFSAGKAVYQPVFSYDVASGRYTQISRDEIISIAQHGSQSRDGSAVAYVQQSATSPGDVFVAVNHAAPRRLTTMNPQTKDFELGATEILHWKSSDGWPVEGMLVKPVGYEAGHHYPLLLRVHGGPTGAFADSYNLDAQYWAGKGWAVLFTNPRGSTGYGEKFLRGNLNDWGGGDYRDIMSGVDAVVASGVADPDHMAEWGWSYGGYMTCWIVSQTHRFKAAMMGAGLSDLVSMYGSTDIPNYLGGFFDGYPDAATLAAYRKRSGLTYVDQVTTPLLMLQGAVDERVPTSQSLEFFRALKDRGKKVELVFYPREHHGFTEYYHQLDRMQRIYDWISHYTLGTSPVAPAGLP